MATFSVGITAISARTIRNRHQKFGKLGVDFEMK